MCVRVCAMCILARWWLSANCWKYVGIGGVSKQCKTQIHLCEQNGNKKKDEASVILQYNTGQGFIVVTSENIQKFSMKIK